jgi:small subunit ribosomal protein S1
MSRISKSAETSAMANFDLISEDIKISAEQIKELDDLFSGLEKFKVGSIIDGTVLSATPDGILVDISYKSNSLVPNYEFNENEIKKIKAGSKIEVVIDRLEDEHGNVVLSHQKAKALKAWERIAELAKNDQPAVGTVTHKVKGGLSVDIGVPAFLPGSQVDIQRVTDFDHFVGQEIEAKILKINKKRGNVIISRRKYLEEQRAGDRVQALDTLSEGQVVEGIVKNITNYGAFVDIGGIDGLLHITDMSWGRIAHPSELVRIGDKITVKLLSFDKEREKISLGMKQLTENPWDKAEDAYAVGMKVKGRISSIADYGLFVEIKKGIEGLVHISEIVWTDRITNLSKHFRVGDEVEAIIVALDKDNRRMSLSIKQLKEDPWKNVATRFKEGDKVTGVISNIADFGLFVQIAEGIDGLVHVSDISWTEHISHPGEKFKKGETIQAVILSIDQENRKISLSIAALDKDPWETIEQQFPVGSVVTGTISKLTNFGAFVKLANGIEGLVHNSELSNKEGEKAEDIVKVGTTGEFKVIKVNKEERKLGLSLKALQEPAQEAPAKKKERVAAKEKEAPVKRTTIQLNNSLQQALKRHAKMDETGEDEAADKKEGK